MWMTAGPRITTNMAGKMKRTVGKSTLVAAIWAFSSACCIRLVRNASEWTRSDLTRPAPYRSAWMMTRGQAADLLQVGTLAHLPQGFAARPAKLDLALDEMQLGGEHGMGRPQLAGHSLQGPRQAQAPLQADHQDVEGVGERAAEIRLPLGFHVIEPEARADHPHDGAARAEEQSYLHRHQAE